MPKQIPREEFNAILEVVSRFPDGASVEDIGEALENRLPRRTLQRRLALLVGRKQLVIEGKGRGRRYKVFPGGVEFRAQPGKIVFKSYPAEIEIYPPISPEGEIIKQTVRAPIQDRRPVGYNRDFLDNYHPNETCYLPGEIRQRLLEKGRSPDAEQPAGTYVRQIFNRLLIDLSWIPCWKRNVCWNWGRVRRARMLGKHR